MNHSFANFFEKKLTICSENWFEYFFLCEQISWRHWNRIQKFFSLFIRGPDGFKSWKKQRSKILWHTPFLGIWFLPSPQRICIIIFSWSLRKFIKYNFMKEHLKKNVLFYHFHCKKDLAYFKIEKDLFLNIKQICT